MKEFKVDANIYLKAKDGDTIEDLIDRLYRIAENTELEFQIYEETAEIREC